MENFVKDCQRFSSHRVRCRYEFFPRHGGFAICDGRGLATYRRHQSPDVELTRPHNVKRELGSEVPLTALRRERQAADPRNAKA